MAISSFYRFLTLTAVASVLWLPSLRGEIITGTYVGDGGGVRGWLSNPDNWSGYEVPGVRYYTDEDKIVVTNGDFGSTMDFSTAGGAGGYLYFSGGGTNVYSTFKLVFHGAIPQYTIANNHTMPIEAGGGLYVEEDCAYAPIFSATGTRIAMRETAPDNRTIHISNDSVNPLVLSSNGETKGAAGYRDKSGYYNGGDSVPPIYSMEGKGVIQWSQSGETSESGGIPVYEIRHSGEGKTVFCSKKNLRANWISVPPSDTPRKIEFTVGGDGKPHEFYIRSSKDQFVIMADTEISGDGIVMFGFGRSTPGFFCISNGVTCTFLSTLWNYNNNSAGASSTWTHNDVKMNEPLPFGVRGGGRLVLVDGTTSNAVMGAAWVTEGAAIEADRIGLKGKGSPLGTGDRIWFSKGGRFIYSGPGETTDRTLCHMEGGGVFEFSGRGDLNLTSICGASDGSALVLSNLTQNALTVTGSITNRLASMSTTIEKAGEGPVRVSGSVDAGCALSVTEGRLLLASTADVKGDLSLSDGTVLAVEGDGAKIATISVLGGTATNSLAAGASLTVASLPVNSAGTLDIVLGSGAQFVVTGASGLAPVWVRVNGKQASFDVDGKICELEVTGHIDAHGGVIPDDAAGAVLIDTAIGPKDENVTLESSATHVAYLQQFQTFDPALVEFPAGYALWTSLISVAPGAKSLTLGNVVGQGTVNVSGSIFQLEAPDASGPITIYPAVVCDWRTTTIAKSGEGNVTFEGGFSGGNLELTGPFSFENSTSGNDAYFRISPQGETPYKFHYHGLMTVADPGIMTFTDGNLKMTGDGLGRVGAVRVNGGCDLTWSGPMLSVKDLDLNKSAAPTNVFSIATNGTAIVRFTDGAYTGRVQVANGVDWGSSAAIYQTGGEICNVLHSRDAEESIGMKGYAYYGMSGGQLVVAGMWMSAGSPGDFVMAMTGGTVLFTQQSKRRSGFMHSSKNSHAVLNVQGTGMFDNSKCASETFMPLLNRINADSEVTVANGGTVYFGRTFTCIGLGLGDRYTPVNVNINEGGLLKVGCLVRYKTCVVKSDEFPEGASSDKRFTNAWASVNFNGGTLESTSTGKYLFGRKQENALYPPTRVIAYEKGAIISRPVEAGVSESAAENTWCGIGERGSIRAPEGNGVYAVEMNDYMRETSFIGSPIVTITGDGKGATAFADFDLESGHVTNITVTCHGENYTKAVANVYRNGSIVTTLEVTLKANTSGGLVKIGGGQLRMHTTNTYTGATCIREGTIKAFCNNPFSDQSRLRLEGGKLIMQTYTQTFADFDYVSGSISGTLPKVTGIVVDMEEVLDGHVKHVCTETDGGAKLVTYTTDHPPVTLINVDKSKLTSNRYTLVDFASLEFATSIDTSETNVPAGWRLGLAGKELRMSRDRGMIIMLRKNRGDY